MEKIEGLKKEGLPFRYQLLLTPLLAILVLVVVAVFGGKFILGKIKSLQAEVQKNQKSGLTLQQKLTSLQSLQGQVLSASQDLAIVLPAENSSLMALSQLKTLARKYEVSLNNLKVGAAVKSGTVYKAEISFDADGGYTSVVNFLRAIARSAPLMSTERVRLTQASSSLVRAATTVSTYWSPFPEKLPAITEKLPELTDKEQELLNELISLEQPPFTEASPSAPVYRPNPFGMD